MPLYTFACQQCGHRFEELVTHSGAHPDKCPQCASSDLGRELGVFAVGKSAAPQRPACAGPSGSCATCPMHT